MTKTKNQRVVKCEGRFHELRDHIYQNVFPLTCSGKTVFNRDDLKNSWDLIDEEIYGLDRADPYYGSPVDTLRKFPQRDYLSLVPLIESPSYGLDSELIRDYALSMGNRAEIADMLIPMARHPQNFFKECFDREPRSISLPGGKNLSGYTISANFGIGTVSPGGVSGGGIKSDAPFLFEVYAQPHRGELELAAVIGCWIQENSMLVSQMQPCKNAHYPEEVKFGVASLHIAETAARLMGLDSIVTYSARAHPIFKEHPDSWGQFGSEFVCIWDNSSAKLGFNGSRTTCHTKNLKSQ